MKMLFCFCYQMVDAKLKRKKGDMPRGFKRSKAEPLQTQQDIGLREQSDFPGNAVEYPGAGLG